MGIGGAAGGSYRRQVPHEHKAKDLLTRWSRGVSGSLRGGVREMWDSYWPKVLQKGFSVRKDLTFSDF